jgi:hypothetical protein
VYFLTTNSEDGKQEEICYQGCRYEIQWKLDGLGFAILLIRITTVLPSRYYSTVA